MVQRKPSRMLQSLELILGEKQPTAVMDDSHVAKQTLACASPAPSTQHPRASTPRFIQRPE